MGEVQLWQSDGLGADRDALEKVLRIFKRDGTQGMESQQALNAYIRKLDDSKLREMHEIDKETALQLFADCFGVSLAAKKYSKWENDAIRKAVDILKKEKETAEREAEENRAELLKARQKLNEEKDKILSDYTRAARKAEEAEDQIRELKDTLARYKADLYDFYAQAGKLQNYERKGIKRA